MNKKLGIVAALVLIALLTALMAWQKPLLFKSSKPATQEAHFVGDSNCAGCHATQTAAWHESQHQKAMQHAGADTVLGNFDNSTFAYNYVTSRFFKRDNKYFVNTDDADGKSKDFEIQYTFGVYPLQQYLVTMPDGRVQALSIAWDSRPKEEGGQRWMHLYSKERIDAHDELHWTKPSQNWNFMCADCHSTDVKKNYDAKSDKFTTTFEAINVGCEACHGPGSAHMAWANAGAKDKNNGLTALFEKHQDVHWEHNKETGKPQRTAPRQNDNEIEVCAQCHSRRAQIAEGYHAGKPFLDYYVPSLPLPPLYHIDGQQREEVYNWASFLQSRMYQAGVTCSDCHEPHTQKLRAEGNALCGQCHLPANYDTPKHTHHPLNSAGSQCVNCHMPATTYMLIDGRRDHSIRVPRPDLSVTTGAPNACSNCHNDHNTKWAADKVHSWLGRDAQGLQNYAGAFHAAEQGEANASDQLAAVVQYVSSPAIAKAAAIELLGSIPSEQTLTTIEQNINAPEPLIRLTAVQALSVLPPADQLRLGTPLLADSVRSIRIEAARVLLPQARQIPEQTRVVFESAVAEYETSLHYNEDRPESRVALGTLQAYRGDLKGAEQILQQTVQAFPTFVPAYINLADVQRAGGDETAVQKTLREGINHVPQDANLHYALGLSLIRSQHKTEAMESLQKATQLAPENTQFAYVYAVGLYETGHKPEALAEINRALKLHPNDANLLQVRDSFNR